MLSFYHEVLFRPLLNLLVFFYDIFGDLGFAIIALTILIRLILYPIAKKSLEHQQSLKKIQPKIKALQEKHKGGDKEKLTAEMMELYKEHNFNPASGCLPMIVQLVILLTLYRVFMGGLHLDSNQLYSFVAHPAHLDTSFLGILDLSQKSMEIHFAEMFKQGINKETLHVISYYGVFLALMASVLQFIQTRMTIRKTIEQKAEEKAKEAVEKKNEKKKEDSPFDMTEAMNTQMLYFFPLLTFYIGVNFQSGLSLYWTVSTLLLVLQQYILNKEGK